MNKCFHGILFLQKLETARDSKQTVLLSYIYVGIRKGAVRMAVNQYVRDRNGENDYKKGNRIKGQPRNGAALAAMNKAYGESVAHYRDEVEAIRQSRAIKQERMYNVYTRLREYIATQREEDRPLTVAGMISASSVSRTTWYEMAGGRYDYQLPQIIDAYNLSQTTEVDGIPATEAFIGGAKETILLIFWTDLVEKAMLAIEEQTEERLYSKGRVGDIFALKAVHGWQEEPSPQTVNQTLVIASPEQAREAIRALK